MTDRELLEAAAKAAGLTLGAWSDDYGAFMYRGVEPGKSWWNALTDDGDALRLAVKLGISVSFSHSTRLDVAYPTISEVGAFAGWCPTYIEANAEDWPAATRRAIVRAAAEIGKGLRPFPSDEEIRENWT